MCQHRHRPPRHVPHAQHHTHHHQLLPQPFTDFEFNISSSNGTNATAAKPERVCNIVVEKRIRSVRLDVDHLFGAVYVLCWAIGAAHQSRKFL